MSPGVFLRANLARPLLEPCVYSPAFFGFLAMTACCSSAAYEEMRGFGARSACSDGPI